MVALSRPARVVAARALSPSVCSLSLELGPAQDGGVFSFQAGQWLHVHVPTPAGPAKRAYSIASDPAAPYVELAITNVAEGAVSPLLCALAPGAALQVDGPHGFFTREVDAPALFVGTGTGLAPLRSMLSVLLADPSHAPVTLLFGVRTQADILWREELEAWAARDPRFRLEVTLSRPDASWRGRSGYVQTHVAELAHALAEAREPSSEPHVYICGLSGMVGAVRALCKQELRFDRKRIHSERYD